MPAGTGTGMEHRQEDGIACCTTPKRAHVGRARCTTGAHFRQICQLTLFGAWRVRLGLCVASQHSTVPVLKIRRETTTRTFANRWKERVHAVHAVHAGCPSMVARDYAAAWLVPDMPLSRAAARAHAIQKNTDYHKSTLRELPWTSR